MNQLMIAGSEMTMTTVDFLVVINNERTAANEKPVRHNDFVARVEDECDDLGAYEIIVSFGKDQKVYTLTMEQMSLVAMRESKSVRRKVLDFIKSRQKPVIPQTYAAALLEAGRLALEVERQAEQLAIAAPKVEFVDKFVTSTGNLGFRQVAKLLKVKETDLRAFLISSKVMYRLAGDMTPYSEHIDAGRFEVKAGVADHGDSSHAYSQAKFTPKGVEWLAGELAKAETKKLMEVVL